MISSKLIARLKNRKYREAFVASQINIGLPFQIRALLKQRGWTQEQFAEKANMLQPRVSAMCKPGGAKFTLETLRRVAAACDVALLVKFVPFSELAHFSEEFNAETFEVPSFDQDNFGAVETPIEYVAQGIGNTIPVPNASYLTTFHGSPVHVGSAADYEPQLNPRAQNVYINRSAYSGLYSGMYQGSKIEMTFNGEQVNSANVILRQNYGVEVDEFNEKEEVA